jgi:putative two-component system response regulator
MCAMMQTERAKVLVVDDEPLVRSMMASWLSRSGFSCVEAENASEAFQIALEQAPSVVATDIRMPGESGLELLVKLKAALPTVEVIVVSAAGDTSTAIQALTSGAFGYLIKPVEGKQLVHEVSKALERRRLMIARNDHLQSLEDTVRDQTLEIRRAHEETIHRLVLACSYRDVETGGHIRRVGLCSEALARAAGWDTCRAEQIRLAAPMHDIGKIAIPDRILQKPGRLTAEEFGQMKMHTVFGARILDGAQSPELSMGGRIALCHHERWDGAGYPRRLAGEQIPEAARIVAIVDVYDALSHDRVYRPAFSESDVMDMLLAGRGTHFEPRLLDLFLERLPEMRAIAQDYPDEEIASSTDEIFYEPALVEA